MCMFVCVADGVPEGWSGRQATEQEKQAATVLQAGWKGYLVREILSAARPGNIPLCIITALQPAQLAQNYCKL